MINVLDIKMHMSSIVKTENNYTPHVDGQGLLFNLNVRLSLTAKDLIKI